jgi:hypothetical protein
MLSLLPHLAGIVGRMNPDDSGKVRQQAQHDVLIYFSVLKG